MSTTSLPPYKKPPHQRHDSGELDVFEAARYFSDYNDNNALVGGEEIVIKDGRQQGYLRQGRASLDLPSLKKHHHHYYKQYHQNFTISQQQQQQQQQQHREEKKKHKQPSSPGGKIAHFLNSIFNQTIITSKKKKQSKSTQSMKDEDESPSSRRKRRSSMSHFRTTNNVVGDSKSLDDSTNLGFRTPPSYTMSSSTKPYYQNNVKSFVDYKQVLATLSKYKIHENGNNANLKDDKLKGNKNGNFEKSKNYANNNNNHGDYQEKKREIIKKFNEEVDDDGAESDESSDLFELKIDYDFEFCSSGLPVYETTHLDNFKRPSTTITSTNGPTKH